MQLFNYTAKDEKSVFSKGKVEARDESAAAAILREKGLVIITLKSINSSGEHDLLSFINNRIRSEDIVAFTQQLSTMIDSGLPLSDALSILQNQSKPALARFIGDMIRDIQGGSTFSDALSTHPGVFSPVYVATIKAGEAAGKIDIVLANLAETEEKKREFASKTKGALIYPIIVMVVMIIVMVVMMVAVVPKLTSMFTEFGTELPVATKVLIAMSDFMQKMWWIFGLMIAGAIYMIKQWYKTKVGRVQIDTMLLKVPVFGGLTTQMMLADITRTLALLVGAGISILEALEIVSDSADNVVFKASLKTVSDGVEKGLPFATMLAREDVFPPFLSQMVSVGEETGKLSAILVKVARFFESESENLIKNLTTAIEPLIMVVLGVGVMFLVLAILMPIYQLTSSF